MKRYECFIFNDELELLEARLREGDGIVDQWVLVEADETFTGQPKPMHFKDHTDLFKEWDDRITYVPVSLPAGDPWEREAIQRNAIHQAIDAADPDDLILIADGDELVPRSAWTTFEEMTLATPVILRMAAFYFTLDLVLPFTTRRSRMARRRHIQLVSAFADAIPEVLGWPQIECGWHFSCLGGPERVTKKLLAFSHTELSNASWANETNVRRLILEGRDIDPSRGWRLHKVDPQGPEWLRTEGVKKWPHLLTGGI